MRPTIHPPRRHDLHANLAVPVTLLVLALGACSGPAPAPEAPGDGSQAAAAEADEAIAVRVAAVTRESISALYSTSATLRADRQATVIARTRGVVRGLEVEEGDLVTQDQALARLEDDEQRIAAARARTARDTSQRDRERLSGLLADGLVSDDEFEKARRDAVDAGHALELAELELSRTVIRAPIPGVILRRHLDVGATVGDGTTVYDIADLVPLYADINIPERHVTRLEIGQQVQLTADATGDTVAARIERIAPLVETQTGTVKVTVAVQGSSQLRPGAFVRVDIVTDTHPQALVVARSALVAEGRRWHLYKLVEGGKTSVSQTEVLIGFENGHRVEITGTVDADELAAGTQVVVVGAPALSDHAVVRVVDDQAQDQPEQADQPVQESPDAG